VFVALGFVAVAVGAVGIVVPLLPTTPLLLLAAYLFWRGSPRWHAWLLNNGLLGSFIRDYVEHRAVPMRSKVIALVVLWSSIGVSFVVVGTWYVGVVLAAIGVAVSVHVLRLKTRR
jgi:uncharacterized membrane protein YbaN (DUF454 family)